MIKPNNSGIDSLFSMVSFGVFAVAVLTALTFGAVIYKGINDRAQAGYDTRACLSYLWTRLKASNGKNAISTGEFSGLASLFIREEYDGVGYQTVIYLYDGWVRELFSEEGLTFRPEDGQPVVKASSLDFKLLEGGLIEARVNAESIYIYPVGAGTEPQGGLSP